MPRVSCLPMQHAWIVHEVLFHYLQHPRPKALEGALNSAQLDLQQWPPQDVAQHETRAPRLDRHVHTTLQRGHSAGMPLRVCMSCTLCQVTH